MEWGWNGDGMEMECSKHEYPATYRVDLLHDTKHAPSKKKQWRMCPPMSLYLVIMAVLPGARLDGRWSKENTIESWTRK